MTYYASLADIKAAIDTTKDTQNDKLMRRCATVSRRVDKLMGGPDVMFFAPVVDTVRILVEPQRINTNLGIFKLDGWWLELSGVTLGNTALTLNTQVVANPPSTVPFREIRLADYSLTWYDRTSLSTPEPLFVTVSGIRGYRRRNATRWLKVDDLAADINASVTTLTVADVDGDDPRGEAPRLSRGHLIRIGTEFMTVLDTNTTSNVVTVERGVNGSTAAAHVTGDDVEVWQVEDDVRYEVARQVGLMTARQTAYDVRQIDELGGSISYPTDLLNALKSTLQGYMNL